MRVVIDKLYSIQGKPDGTMFAQLKTDLFGNGSTPAMVMDSAVTTGISITGATTNGFTISGTSTTGVTISGATTTGISITPAAAPTCAILIGTSISAGIPMTSTKNGLIRAFGEIQATEALSNDIRGAWFRVRQNANCDLTGGYSVVGVQGSCKAYGHGSGTTTTLWNHSGVYGSFESDGVASSNVASTGRIAGVMGVLGLGDNFTISSGGTAAALMALSVTNSSATATGTFAGVYVGVNAGSKAFTNGIEIQASAVTNGISISTCTAAMTLAGTITNAIDVTAAATLTNLVKFNAIAGCVVSTDVNPKDVPSTGGLGADGAIAILIGSNTYYIPIFDTLTT